MLNENPISHPELQARYDALLLENRLLKEELNRLQSRLGVTGPQPPGGSCPTREDEPESIFEQSPAELSSPALSNRSDSPEKSGCS